MKLITKYIALTSFLLLLSFSSYSQGYNNPQETIMEHLRHLQNDAWNPTLAGNSLYGPNLSGDKKGKLAIMLKEVLDRNNLFILEHKLPNDPNYFDSTHNAHIFWPFESYSEISVQKFGDKWYYSENCVSQIPNLYSKSSSWWQEQLMLIIPSSLKVEIGLGLKLWQPFAIILIILISYLVFKILTKLLTKYVLNRFASNERTEGLNDTVKDIISPLSLSIALLLLIPLTNIIQLPIHFKHYTIVGVKILLYINGILVCYQLVDLIVFFISKYTAKTESTLDDQIIPLIRKILKVLVVIIGILFILQSLDVNITTLLAGLSIGGLAFAFAAQDTIKNLFGSIMIFIDRPFQIGDYVSIGGVGGVVEEVGFRSTRIRTLQSSLVSIPNGALADQTVDNLGKRQFRRFNTTLGINYDTPPHLIEAFVNSTREIVTAHPAVVKDSHEIHLSAMGDFSLNILLHMKLSVSGWNKELEAKHEIYMTIIKLAYELGVNFAFPTQTLHVENFPEKKSISSNYSKRVDEEGLQKFLNNYKSNIKYEA
mgnify:CR=1 FL=1